MSEMHPHQGITVSNYVRGSVNQLIREKDWSRTAIGPIESWPLSLQSYVNMILALPTPAVILWGKERIQIYNDAYSVIMGPRHPEHLGSKFQDCWKETYAIMEPLMKRVIFDGEVMTFERAPIAVSRHGFLEEAHFTFTLSPLENDQGEIEGVIQLVTEVTPMVLTERRLDLLRKISPSLDPQAQGLQEIIENLEADTEDIRFALLFLPQLNNKKLKLSAHFGIAQLHENSSLADPLLEWVQKAYDMRIPLTIYDIQSFIPHNPHPPWPEKTRDAMVVPLISKNSNKVKGAIVLGISPRLKFDVHYRSFFVDVAREIDLLLEVGEQACINEMIKENEKRFEAIIQHIGEGLYLLDGKGNILMANPAALKHHGFKNEAELVKTIFELPKLFRVYNLHGSLLSFDEWPMMRTIRGERFHEYIVEVERIDTKKRIYGSFSGSPVFGEDHRVKLAVITMRNVTQRMKIENDLKKAITARDEFLSIASHELKTPVTSLKLQLQVTKRAVNPEKNMAPGPEKLAKVLDVSLRQINRLAELIDNLLDVARIQTGRLNFNLEPVDLGNVVMEIVDRFNEQLIHAHCPINLSVHEPVIVSVDRFRIEQVITNLLTNAMKYGPGKPINIIVEKKDKNALLTVQDFGIGIDKESQKKIFNRFERIVSANNVSGLGLGLYITKEIVEAHGGTIMVESEPDVGSKFIVQLKIL